MVEFKSTMGGFDVLVNGELFGRLQKGKGFFTDQTVVKDYLEVSSENLKLIALKSAEAKAFGNVIPVCPVCNGTPNFPNEVYSPNEGMLLCGSELHHALSRRR